MNYARIIGTGSYLPEKVLTNADLEQMIETTAEWIIARTGVEERHIAAPGETTCDLAEQASRWALAAAGIEPADIDLIILGTTTPDHVFPSVATQLQHRLGCYGSPAFDVQAVCTGFVYALDIAHRFIRTGAARRALVVGADTFTRIIDWTDRGTCILFGDGAGAFVLQAAEERAGVLSAVMRSDGSGGDLLSVPGGGSRYPTTMDTVQQGMHHIHMNGREVFRFATRVMSQATQEAVEQAGLTLDDIQLVIPHQANQRIIEAALKSLDIPLERCMINLDRYGNTSTASIPIATCEAFEAGRILPGNKLVFVGFGAGLTWGAAVVEWSGPFAGIRKVRPARYRWYARIRSIILRVLRHIDAWIWGRQNS